MKDDVLYEQYWKLNTNDRSRAVSCYLKYKWKNKIQCRLLTCLGSPPTYSCKNINVLNIYNTFKTIQDIHLSRLHKRRGAVLPEFA